MSLGLCSTSDAIAPNHNCHHLGLTSAGGKDLSNDTQIKVIVSMEPEIYTKMLRNWSEKLGAKFPVSTGSNFTAKKCPS